MISNVSIPEEDIYGSNYGSPMKSRSSQISIGTGIKKVGKPPKQKIQTFGEITDLKSDVRKKYKKLRKSIDMDPKTNENFKKKMRNQLDQTVLTREVNFKFKEEERLETEITNTI